MLASRSASASASPASDKRETKHQEQPAEPTTGSKASVASAAAIVWRQGAVVCAAIELLEVGVVALFARVGNAVATNRSVAIGSARVRDAVTVLRSIVAIFGAGDGAVAADRVDVGDDAQIVDGPTAEFEAAIALDFEANLNLVAAGEFTERNVVETPLFVFMVDGARVAHVAV